MRQTSLLALTRAAGAGLHSKEDVKWEKPEKNSAANIDTEFKMSRSLIELTLLNSLQYQALASRAMPSSYTKKKKHEGGSKTGNNAVGNDKICTDLPILPPGDNYRAVIYLGVERRE